MIGDFSGDGREESGLLGKTSSEKKVVGYQCTGARFPQWPAGTGQGQGALEYLMLAGGGVIVVILVLLAAIATTPFGGTIFNQNKAEYDKLDLCTVYINQGNGLDAVCSLASTFWYNDTRGWFGMDFSTITWRTLEVVGLRADLYCGNVLCKGSDFAGLPQPQTTIALPIAATNTTPQTPVCSTSPQTGLLTCTTCNPSVTPSCQPDVPYEIYRSYCPNPGDDCSINFDFLDPVQFPTPVIVRMDPTTVPLFARIKGAPRIAQDSRVTELRFSPKVRVLDNGQPGPTAIHHGISIKRFYSYPYFDRGFTVCQGGNPNPVMSVSHPSDCEVQLCDDTAHSGFCSANSISQGAPICVSSGSPSTFSNAVTFTGGQSPTVTLLPAGANSYYTAAIDLGIVGNRGRFIPGLSRGFSFLIYDADSSIVTCNGVPNPSFFDCDTACENRYGTPTGIMNLNTDITLDIMSDVTCNAAVTGSLAITPPVDIRSAGAGTGMCIVGVPVSASLQPYVGGVVNVRLTNNSSVPFDMFTAWAPGSGPAADMFYLSP